MTIRLNVYMNKGYRQNDLELNATDSIEDYWPYCTDAYGDCDLYVLITCRTVHNGMAAIQFVLVVQSSYTLLCKIITAIHNPPGQTKHEVNLVAHKLPR